MAAEGPGKKTQQECCTVYEYWYHEYPYESAILLNPCSTYSTFQRVLLQFAFLPTALENMKSDEARPCTWYISFRFSAVVSWEEGFITAFFHLKKIKNKIKKIPVIVWVFKHSICECSSQIFLSSLFYTLQADVMKNDNNTSSKRIFYI